MSDVNCIIFSKNRAMQLDALLRSIERYAPSLIDPIVVFNVDGADHCSAYKTATDEHEALWRSERIDGFKLATIRGVSRCSSRGEWRPAYPYTMFLVDDDLFYRPLPEFTVKPGTAYAPRLGWNTTHCYTINQPQQVPTKLYRDVGGEGNLDFDATFSLDGHVYLTDEILPYLESAEYSNPNELETALCGSIRPRLKFAEHSCLVGIPHNRVGPNHWNRHAGGSADELNKLFLEGWRIDLDAMDFSNVRSVHQEIQYKFTRFCT